MDPVVGKVMEKRAMETTFLSVLRMIVRKAIGETDCEDFLSYAFNAYQREQQAQKAAATSNSIVVPTNAE